MAISNDPLFSRLQGKIGNLVIYQMYGKTVLRTKPSVKRKPAKGRLKESQNNFKFVMQTMKLARPFVIHGFREVANGRSAFHTALSANLIKYRLTDDKSYHKWLHLSEGNRAGTIDSSLQLTEDRKLMINWEAPEPNKPFSNNDRLMFFAICNTQPIIICELYTARRDQHLALIEMPINSKGLEFECFISFRSELPTSQLEPDLISDSKWIGNISL
jgi:hypothetical protein